jgi:hypothetical protein
VTASGRQQHAAGPQWDPVPPSDPSLEYTARLVHRRNRLAALTARDAQIAVARLVLFGAFLLLLVLAWRYGVSPWWLAVPVPLFAGVAVYHDGVIRERDAVLSAIGFYERGLARIEDRWSGTGEPGERFRDDRHSYAADLDIFGRGSLFELLSIARTRAGESTLAAWLTAPAAVGEILTRHEAVRELTPALDLRERLAASGSAVRAAVDGEALVAWAEGPTVLSPPWLRLVAAALTAGTLATVVLLGTTGDPGPLLVMLAVQSVFSAPQGVRIMRALHAANGPARDLDVLRHLLEVLERERFSAPRLAALQQQIQGDHVLASLAIRRLQRLVEMHDWQHNMMFVAVALALMWGTHIAWAIEAWRQRHGRLVATWLGAVGEFEALGSISAYRYEHPADPFPEIVESAVAHVDGAAADAGRIERVAARNVAGPDAGHRDRPPALFDGIALGHPLLPAAKMVRNDVRLDSAQRLLIVSGSNMSGKSTLLRTVGVNAVLAYAGAPVRATRLTLSPLGIGATLRIQDSLQEGRSRFYAEITRLRELADMAKGPAPLLFLLDELLHGTNSHDRLAGATGVLRSLVDRGAVGLVTTHDLALTAASTDLRGAANVHFEEWFEAGEMRFDFTMKAGPVTRSNALALMRAVGLDVPEQTP